MTDTALDPLPWLVQYDEETPLARYKTHRHAWSYALPGDEVVFSPRPGYDQNREAYQ